MPEKNPKKAALKASAAQMARILDAGGAAMLDGGLPELLSLKAGQQVGARRFTLVKRLGRGGMGVVWLAHDTRLDESVALKFLPPEISSDPAALNDLRRETVRSHHLTHPNIIRIHDFHQTDDVAFISMEYVDGATLSDRRLQQTGQVLTWEQLAPLVQQLCAALEYAHGEKVIHRDLKPSNMMVDSKGRLKLADFGIAAVASDSMSKVSVQHATSGTPPYMSPQQLAGKRPQATDDIYALGATLYELLTGKPPFYTGDITHQVMNQTPEPMEERLGALGIDNEIPPAVGAMVMACLAKEPEQRPQSARAVAEWIGLETQVKPATESVAAAFFRPTPSSPRSLLADHPTGNVPARPARLGRNLAAVGIVVLVLAAALWLWKEVLRHDHSIAPGAAGISADSRLRPEMLWGKRFLFSFKSDSNGGSNGKLTLQTNGTIAGTTGPNETFWLIDRDGHLVIKHLDGRVSTIFTVAEHRDGKWYFCGQYQFNPRVQNFLEEDVTTDAVTTITGRQPPQPGNAINPAAVADLKRGLMLYFSFDEPPKNGVVHDDSGSGNDGFVDGATWTPDGRRGGAYQFHRINSLIRVTNKPSLNPPQITMAAWIKTSYTDNLWRRVIDKGGYTGPTLITGYTLSMVGDADTVNPHSVNRGRIAFEVPGAWHVYSDSNTVADGRWHCVVATYDGAMEQLFVDGRAQNNPVRWDGRSGQNTYDLFIGANPSRGETFDGTIDEVMMYNRALSPDEVRQLYELTSVPLTATNAPALKEPDWISSQVPKPGADGWIVLFDGKRLYGCSPPLDDLASGKISIQDGFLRLDSIALDFNLIGRDVAIRARLKKASGAHCDFCARRNDGKNDGTARDCEGCFEQGNSFFVGHHVDQPWRTLASTRTQQNFPGFFEMEFRAEGENLTLKADGRDICIARENSIMEPGRICARALSGITLYQSIEAQMLDKIPSTAIRATTTASTSSTATAAPLLPQGTGTTPAGPDAKPRVRDFNWTLDTSQSPDLKEWAETKLKPVVDQWYPLLVVYFASDGFTAPTRFKITISPSGGNVAFAGTNIRSSEAWVKGEISKPGDWNQATGAVIWALARMVQQYGNSPWLAYGVANYYRWFCYEPLGHRPKMSALSAAGHNNSDNNMATECFLDYLVKIHDSKSVSKMNTAMRQGRYSSDLWKEYTGMSVEELWAEYVKSL